MRWPVSRAAAIISIFVSFSFGYCANAATREQIDRAVENAKNWLYSQQSPQGDWEPVPVPIQNGIAGKADLRAHQWGGTTAMVVAGLLRSGESYQDAHIAPAIAFLGNAKVDGVYSSSLRANVWPLVTASREHKALANNDFKLLLSEANMGFFPWYTGAAPPLPREYQPLLGQAAVCAIADLDAYGFQIPNQFWRDADRGWRRAQLPSGAWPAPVFAALPLAPPPVPDFAATAAAISVLGESGSRVNNEGALCRGNRSDPDIDKAITWLDANMPPGFPAGHFEWLEPLQRAATWCGKKRLNGIDWFDQGASWLLQNQNANGSWGNGVFETARALDFLSTGDVPIILNKLEYQPPGANGATPTWNERPDDARNFGNWLASRMCYPRGDWQQVNFGTPLQDLQDVPVLYISGNADLNFAKAEIEKLRKYVLGGGLIVGNADCGSEAFSKSFEILGNSMFPIYEFRELASTHPIYISEQYMPKHWKVKPTIRGMTNGVRELMLLFPESDPAKAWETRSTQTRKESFELMGDVVNYATGKRVPIRTDALRGPPAPAVKPDRQITAARLVWNGNCDPEPGGWPRLAALMLGTLKTELKTEQVKLGTDSLRKFRLAHLTGTGAITLDEKERKELTEFVTSGGTLVIDAAGGDPIFGDAMASILTDLFCVAAQDGLDNPLRVESDVFDVKSHPMEQVGYRVAARLRFGHKPKGPNIFGIEINHRIGVLFSREDLSAGLAGVKTDGIVGYEPASAVDLMSRLIIYGADSHPK